MLLGQHDHLYTMAREHEQLYDAIADRDVERVQALVAAHLATGRTIVIERHRVQEQAVNAG